MEFLDKTPYNQNILYKDDYKHNNLPQRIYFQKSILTNNNRTQYFFKTYILYQNNLICQGYIYFYLNEKLKSSDFIGLYVKPEYRNLGIASLLVANWIEFCLDNNYIFLETNKKQRKPFLLYLLKTYGFEIFDNLMYKFSNDTIHICQSKLDNNKYLLFENTNHRESFMRGKIAKEDNYKVIDELNDNMRYLDSIILSMPYYMQDTYKAEEKTSLVIKRHKK